MKRRPLFAIVLLAGLVAGAPAGTAAAQTPPASPPAQFGGQIQVSEVLIDALVSDAAGNVVLGLGKDDFVVEEDGKPVTLNDVSFYSNRRLVDAPERARRLGVAPGEVPADRYFILFFDDPRSALPRLSVQQLDAGRRAEQWVRSELLPNDYVAVVGYDFRLKVYSDFSDDAAKVVAGIENAMVGKEIDDYGARPARWVGGLAARRSAGGQGCHPRRLHPHLWRPRAGGEGGGADSGSQEPGAVQPRLRRGRQLRLLRPRPALLPADGPRAERRQRRGVRHRLDPHGGSAARRSDASSAAP